MVCYCGGHLQLTCFAAGCSYHKSPQFKAHGIKGTSADHCHPAINKYMIIFGVWPCQLARLLAACATRRVTKMWHAGAIQMLFIQIPNL